MKIIKSLILVFAISLVLLASCKNNANQQTTQEPNPQPEAQVAPQPEAKPEVKDNALTSELKNLFSKKASIEWQITYDVKTKAAGTEQKMTMIQYMKGPTKVRSDVTVQGIESRSYFVDNVMTSCSKMQNKWSCFKIEAKKDDAADMEKNFQSNPGQYTVTADGTKSVAGLTAKCYKIVDSKNSAQTRECFSDDGMPLYIYYEGSGITSEMTALTYAKAVSASVFTPPVEAKEMSVPTTAGAAQGDACAACDYLSGDMKDQCLANC